MSDTLNEVTTGPFVRLLEVLALPPDMWHHALVLLSSFCVASYLLRTALMIEAPQSRVVHMIVCTLTLLPGIVLAGVLVWADAHHRGRGWFNLGIAAAAYVAWYAGGAVTRLARADTEGGDLGWLAMAALITFPIGLISALVFA